MTPKKATLKSTIAAILMTTPLAASAVSFKDSSGTIDFSIGGFAKLSAIYSDTDSGKIDNVLGRNIYLPSATPVGNGQDHQVLDLTARESRINFKAKTEKDGHKIGMTLEIDFLGTSDGNEVVSNSYAPRLRHFFFTFDNHLFGQTWSTFQDVGALAESVDFLPAPEGIVFIRQAQYRYTAGDLQIGLENPENWIEGNSDRDVGVMPDITANYKMKGDWGHMRINGLLRQLVVDEGTIDETATGYGIGLSGKIKVGSTDDIRFSATYGDGMGRYTGLGLVKDGVLINGNIETVSNIAANAAYRHVWNGKSSSNIIYSLSDIDNPDGSPGTLNKSASSLTVNYLYRPIKNVTYGIMLMVADRELENGDDGKMNRVQASAKYAF